MTKHTPFAARRLTAEGCGTACFWYAPERGEQGFTSLAHEDPMDTMNSVFELSGKAVLVTGAASGIGRATTELLLSLGARVVALDRDNEALEGLCSSHSERVTAGQLTAHEVDVTDKAHVCSVIQGARAERARLDGLVHCAGVVRADDPSGPGIEDYDVTMDTNVRGTLNLVAAVKPIMKAQQSGSIVLLGSVVGHLGWPNRSVYCASKGAVHALTRALAVELAPASVRVNAIAPGLVWTPMIEQVVARAADPRRAFALRCVEQANGRMLAATEVARAALFFVSSLSAPATGCVHDLSVGRTAGHIPSLETPGPEFERFCAEHLRA